MTIVGELDDPTVIGVRPRPEPGALWIEGRWRDAATGRRREVMDPGHASVITTVAEAGGDDVRLAVSAARQAADSGVWSRLAPRERGRVLHRLAALMDAHHEELAALEALDTGKPLHLTRTTDVPSAVAIVDYYASLTAAEEGSVRSTTLPALAYVAREPVGVVAAITPFNFPLVLGAMKVASALAAGNTVVLKPSEETPLTTLRLAEIACEAGLPDGVLNVVTGGAAAGQVLVETDGIDLVSFSGSSQVGSAVAQAAAVALRPAVVALGGKSANLVLDDADVPRAVETAVDGFLFNSGQFCMAGTRLLVHRAVHDAVLAGLAERIASIPVGDPFGHNTFLGPMTGRYHEQRVRHYLTRARETGHEVIAAPEVDRPGYYVPPSVICGAAQGSPWVQEEIMGPVLTVQPFDTDDEAVALANGTRFSLAAGIQTSDVARAHRLAARLTAGLVWVNGWAMFDPSIPMGGMGGGSGFGRELGPEGLRTYQRTKSVVVNLE